MHRRCLRFFEKITFGFFQFRWRETEAQKAPRS
jgi:hypothetical protein